MALHCMAHSFVEFDKAGVHVIRLVSFLWLWFSSLRWIRIRGLWKLPDWETDWGGNWVLFWWAGPCSVNLYSAFLLVWSLPVTYLRANYVGVMKIMVASFKRSHAPTAPLSSPHPATVPHRPPPPPGTPGLSRQVWVSHLWGHCSFLLGPGVHKVLYVPSKSWVVGYKKLVLWVWICRTMPFADRIFGEIAVGN